jgi:hypothetical protein
MVGGMLLWLPDGAPALHCQLLEVLLLLLLPMGPMLADIHQE